MARGKTACDLPTSVLELADEEKLSDISSGANHLVLLTTHGNIYTWGVGECGQLGSADIDDELCDEIQPPTRVILCARNRRAVMVGAGDSHSFAVDSHGDVWGWGLNAHGQIGTGFSNAKTDCVQTIPKKVVGLSRAELGGKNVIEIAVGEFHSIFLVEDGRVFACGRSLGGELGLARGHIAFKNRLLPDCLSIPTKIEFPNPEDKIIHIAAGARRSMAITESGVLYAWGEGGQSELGLGRKVEQMDEPAVVQRPSGSLDAVAVSCGGQHTVGLYNSRAKFLS
jgi:regulator of chromosome condensation